jgi:hypothetical protein
VSDQLSAVSFSNSCTRGYFQSLSLREAALCAATKQSSWIAAARFAHLAMTVILKTRRS